jgi:hypothetical protein
LNKARSSATNIAASIAVGLGERADGSLIKRANQGALIGASQWSSACPPDIG